MSNKENVNIPFLGRGWSFPPEFDNATGKVKMSEGETDIKESLEVLLSTEIGERIINPQYGCDLNALLFESLTLSTERELKDKIEMAILRYEPRIKTEDIDLLYFREEGKVEIHIQYVIRTTNNRSNMVYPFYLNEGTNL